MRLDFPVQLGEVHDCNPEINSVPNTTAHSSHFQYQSDARVSRCSAIHRIGNNTKIGGLKILHCTSTIVQLYNGVTKNIKIYLCWETRGPPCEILLRAAIPTTFHPFSSRSTVQQTIHVTWTLPPTDKVLRLDKPWRTLEPIIPDAPVMATTFEAAVVVASRRWWLDPSRSRTFFSENGNRLVKLFIIVFVGAILSSQSAVINSGFGDYSR